MHVLFTGNGSGIFWKFLLNLLIYGSYLSVVVPFFRGLTAALRDDDENLLGRLAIFAGFILLIFHVLTAPPPMLARTPFTYLPLPSAYLEVQDNSRVFPVLTTPTSTINANSTMLSTKDGMEMVPTPTITSTSKPIPTTSKPILPPTTPIPPSATHVSVTNTPSSPPTKAPTRLPTHTPAHKPTSPISAGSTMVSEKDGMEMVYVPAGTFLMGSPEGEGDKDEHPQHTMYLDAFWIDKTEVTNAQYQKCVIAGQCEQSSKSDDSDFNQPDYPVVGVSWQDANAYCQWAGRRLPTEAEWKKAARGDDDRVYPWGNDFVGSKLNYCDTNCRGFLTFIWRDRKVDDGFGKTAPVGSYPAGASPYGALDMAGNVREWVADWYDGDYYSNSPSRNPTGPATGRRRVLRGGSWFNLQFFVRAADRVRDYPDFRGVDLGFRCLAPSP